MTTKRITLNLEKLKEVLEFYLARENYLRNHHDFCKEAIYRAEKLIKESNPKISDSINIRKPSSTPLTDKVIQDSAEEICPELKGFKRRQAIYDEHIAPYISKTYDKEDFDKRMPYLKHPKEIDTDLKKAMIELEQEVRGIRQFLNI